MDEQEKCYLCDKTLAVWDNPSGTFGWQTIYPEFCPGCGKKKEESPTYMIQEIHFSTLAEATRVFLEILSVIEDYGFITVADYYDLVGRITDLRDFNYGWNNISAMHIWNSKDGYYIDLPRPQEVKGW